ncbi:SMI1/KNR4 family protein [Chitinophaga vietnamensis]|uniref:SMI1/KNR4 family protein n=1 Tax=Chitinophaga vietnamensis TaxID=2593957 RepID=UPI0011776584|nr:SMI1/KNR4 family protein [Chitinophaga vietnamensis]
MAGSSQQQIEKALGLALPAAYAGFLQQQQLRETSAFGDELMLYGMNDLVERNQLYEVQKYLPGYISIGDDGGGQAILLNTGNPAVYITGYGALFTNDLQLLDHDFQHWTAKGYSLQVIRESPSVAAFQASETFRLRQEYHALTSALTNLNKEKEKWDLKSYLLRKKAMEQAIRDFKKLHEEKL